MIFTKRIDWLMIRTFIGPLVMNFLIILFILVLQFVAMYIQDIMGKGIGPVIFMKLFVFASGHLSLSAMPVAILAAALMTLGGMGERYELAAIKSSGINVFTASRTLVLSGVILTLFMMWFSFNVVPRTNLKFFSLIHDIKKKKADIALKPGHFYRDIDNFVIYVGDKHKDNGTLYRVRIYKHIDGGGNNDVIQADSARVDLKKDRMAMILYSGVRYEEVEGEDDPDNYPFARTSFDSLIYKFDLGDDFELNRTDESQFKHQITLTRNQLGQALDSIGTLSTAQDVKTFQQLARYNKVDTQLAVVGFVDSAQAEKAIPPVETVAYDGADSLISCLGLLEDPQDILTRALTNARAVKSYLEFAQRKKEDQFKARARYSYEHQLRLAIPVNCLLFLLIGVSLGSIIRKGGLGVPALVSITLFILFYVLTTYGRKASKDGNIDPWLGAWISVMVFTPLAIILVYQATTDSRILDESQWGMIRDRVWLVWNFLKEKVLRIFPSKKSRLT